MDAIVTVSGDGLLWEVINGLMQRKDSLAAIKIPVGIIPAGLFIHFFLIIKELEMHLQQVWDHLKIQLQPLYTS